MKFTIMELVVLQSPDTIGYLFELANKYGVGYALFSVVVWRLYVEMKFWRKKYLDSMDKGTHVITRTVERQDEIRAIKDTQVDINESINQIRNDLTRAKKS